MLSVTTLRSLGPDELAALIRRRPELLRPSPPGSLQELVARLRHRALLIAALRRLDLATLQIAEVLASLGDRADRASLLGLLGIGPDDERLPAVDRALGTLQAHLLTTPDGPGGRVAGRPGYRPLPELRSLWGTPLGLDDSAETLATRRTADDLRSVLRHHDEPTAGRKTDLVTRVVAVLSDADRVRRIVATAPSDLADQLREVAHGRATLQSYGWRSTRYLRPGEPVRDPVDWALARFLLVRQDWMADLAMPAEVALALRGPGWVAPFDAEPPAVDWSPRPPDTVRRAATAAASAVLQTINAVLTATSTRPVPLLKSGAVGVRELRRLADAVGCAVPELRLSLALTYHLGLFGADDEGMAPTRVADAWQARPAAERYADVLASWLDLRSSPLQTRDAAWAPLEEPTAIDVRRAVLTVLADRPDAAPESAGALVARMYWSAPLLLAVEPTTPAARGAATTEDIPPVVAVLQEAEWLGVTGADALSPAGAALLDPVNVPAAVSAAIGDALGQARATARLQTDLTAVVLGEPSAQLAATLDAMADRENRSAASIWRFSPASVRRAMDAGADASTLLAQLTDLAEGPVPQPLEYLLGDVARRHGTLRGAGVGCYLRSDDEALLHELVADRKLRKLGLRQIAPTVVVGGRPLPETLDALRSAGHAPVEEGPDGATVVAARRRHRAASPQPSRSRSSRTARPSSAERSAPGSSAPEPAGTTGDAASVVAHDLLAGPDDPLGALVDLGTTVVDLARLRPHRDAASLW